MIRARNLVVSAFVMASVGATAVWAHGGATGIVKERMDAMVAIAGAMKELVGMSRSGNVNPDRAAIQAETLRAHSGAHMTAGFPEGSMQKASEASLAIWDDWEAFEALAKRLEGLSEGVAASLRDAGPKTNVTFSTSDPLPSVEVLAAMPLDVLLDHAAKTCSSCHQAFRIKK